MFEPSFQRRSVRLKPLQIAGFPQPLDLVDGRLTIGRAIGNGVTLPAETFPSVSGNHLLIEEVDGQLWVEDLESRNGTLVNGKKVDRTQLEVGDVIQLGAIGPRFVVISAEPLSQTMFVDPSKMAISEGDVEQLVRQRSHRQSLVLTTLLLCAIGALVWWILTIAEAGRRDSELARNETEDLIHKLRTENLKREGELSNHEAERSDYIEVLRGEVQRNQTEAKALRERLANLEITGASAEEMARLKDSLELTRKDLEEARQGLTMVDPVNLEASRLSGVAQVREAVVLIETEMLLEKEGKALHLDPEQGPNWTELGEPWTAESTGTGFVVSADGYIVTNAHVIEPNERSSLVATARESGVAPRMKLWAVFDGETVRHEVQLVRRAPDVDLALVRIEPFEGMPHLEEFSIEVSQPPEGSDVYLVGFPLGNFAIQEGRRVHASTFRGILSRVVDGNLQVDAGVHPGNSGGPITNPSGQVIGVVFSVQATPDQTAVYTIGYGIPIGKAASIWPPPIGASDG